MKGCLIDDFVKDVKQMDEVICKQEIGGGICMKTEYIPIQPLIRCKDCKFSEKRETYNKEYEYKCKLSEYEGCFDYHHKNWFCADGERK